MTNMVSSHFEAKGRADVEISGRIEQNQNQLLVEVSGFKLKPIYLKALRYEKAVMKDILDLLLVKLSMS